MDAKMSNYYILNENKEVIESTEDEWSDFFKDRLKTKNSLVKQQAVNGNWVSTVFLSSNDSLDDNELKIFETMVFNIHHREIYCKQYSTYKEAEIGHEKAVQWVKDGCKND